MYRITNISGQVIGLVFQNEDGSYRQENLFAGKTKEIERCEGQIYNLCDPYKSLIRVEEVVNNV